MPWFPSQGVRRVLARAPAVLLAMLVAAGLVASASDAQRPARARAEAAAIAGTLGDAGRIATRGGRETAGAAASLGAATTGGGTVSVQASTTGDAASARGAAVVTSVSLLDGLVRASRVRRTATATAAGTTYDGRVDGLRIGGRRIGDVTATRTYELPDGVGAVTVNRAQEGLVVELVRPVGGAPAGAIIVVAEVSASARDAVAAPEPTATATPRAPKPEPEPEPQSDADADEGKDDGADSSAGARKRARDEAAARRRARERAARERERRAIRALADGDFRFPVAGPTTFSDDWGGPRQIGPHQGNDIFAPFGAPVVAVADGVIEKVGTLDISGNRLWLRTPEGDTFFYAHLASFAPAARTGRRVKAGAVLGYVGNTGDAEPTPPHLHFEAHPGDGAAVNPFEALTAWQARSGVAGGDGATAAEQPGALVEVRDLIAG